MTLPKRVLNTFMRLLKLGKLLGLYGAMSFVLQWCFRRDELLSLRPRVEGKRVTVYCRRELSDMHVLWQTLGRKESRVDIGFDPELVIDGGANIGLTALQYCRCYPAAKVMAIEPDLSSFDLLIRNTQGHPNIIPIFGAVWGVNEPLRLANVVAPSWERQVTQSETAGSDVVPAYTVLDLLRMSSHDRIGLLKLDIEGAEIEVFGTDADAWLPYTDAIVVETHDRLRAGCSATVKLATDTQDFIKMRSGEYEVYIRRTAQP